MKFVPLSAALFAAISVAPALAQGQPAPAPPGPSPGPPASASASAEQEARALFAQGNTHFASNDLPRAAELYQAALERWDQPGIRFNLAVVLIELDRSRQAYQHLTAALEHPEALGERVGEARNYLRLLRARLGTITVTCPGGATCEIDGQGLTAGASKLTLEPGSHTLAARQRGHEAYSRTLVLEPGTSQAVDISMSPRRARLVRRWASWVPWSVVGGGALIAAAGGGAVVLGRREVADVRSEFDARCATGCAGGTPPDLAARSDRAHRQQQLGYGVLSLGGAALATGVLLVVLNQPTVEAAPALSLGHGLTGDATVASVGGLW
ncbi:MAG: hypothetical protein IPI49_32415 [Myxococcales bacterium]|nr:hypothetical protein [Myxococcales bacterium]